jgi:hypothetical protein
MRIFETLRFFFISLETLVVLVGLIVELQYSSQILSFVVSINPPDGALSYLTMLPVVLCGWNFASGRKLLFPQKDQSNVLLEWPDFWRLKAGFTAALAWSVVFAAISIVTSLSDWKVPTSMAWISLAVSTAGAAICSLSIYNAQTNVEEALGRLRSAI